MEPIRYSRSAWQYSYAFLGQVLFSSFQIHIYLVEMILIAVLPTIASLSRLKFLPRRKGQNKIR